ASRRPTSRWRSPSRTAASRRSTRPSPSTARRRPRRRGVRSEHGGDDSSIASPARRARRGGVAVMRRRRREIAMSEDLEFLLELVHRAASAGLMYFLIAPGFVLVYKATDAINFAQGEFVMLAGMIVVTVLGFAGVPLIAAIVVVLLAMIGFGFGLERVVLRPLLGRPVVAVIMATIGVAAVLRGLGPITLGIETRALPLPIGDEPIVLGPASLPPIQILGAVVAIVFFIAFSWLFKKSRMGVAMRAVADNQQVAQAMG